MKLTWAGGLVVVGIPGKTPQLLVAAIACAVMLATPTSAAPIGDIMYLDGATLNLASDNDAQELFFDANGDGSLAPGDVLRGVIDFNTLNSTPANVGGITGNNEWSAVFSLQVVATIPVDVPEFLRPVNNNGPGLFRIVFGPDPAFPGFLAGLDPGAPPAPPGTMVRFYEDVTPDADFTTSLPVAYDTAGPSFFAPSVPPPASVFWDLGFTGPPGAVPGEGWVVPTGTLAVTPAAGVNPGSVLGISNFGLSLLASPSGYGIVPQPMDPGTAWILGWAPGTPVDFVGSSTLRGAQASTAAAGFHADSDTSMTFLAVPEPATLALLALGGLAIIRRRRK